VSAEKRQHGVSSNSRSFFHCQFLNSFFRNLQASNFCEIGPQRREEKKIEDKVKLGNLMLDCRAGSGLNNVGAGQARALHFGLGLFEGLGVYFVNSDSGSGFF
jgi:hypothetical protein